MMESELASTNDFLEIRIPVAWGHIAAKAWGDSSAFPVLGLHGWTDNAGTFDCIAPLLPKTIYLVAIDFPGHGKSSPPPPGILPHLQDGILAIKRLVDAYFKWTKFSIIGHSMGAWFGFVYAAMFPCEVVHLVSLDVIKPFSRDCGNNVNDMVSCILFALAQEQRQHENEKPETYTYSDMLRVQRGFSQNALTLDAAKILVARGSCEVSNDEYTFTRDIRFLNEAAISSNVWCEGDTKDVMQRLRCRLLILKARDGHNLESEGAISEAFEIYKKNCASFEYHEVDGNHYFHLNDPHEGAGLIGQFIAKT